MAEETTKFVIPQEVVDDLSRLAPYKGGENFTTPKEYIINYFLLATPETFYKDGTSQCGPGCRRSFLDLYFLTKAQFEDLESEEFIKLMFSLLYKEVFNARGERRQIYLMYCPDIRRPVMRTVGYSRRGVNGPEDLEQYGLRYFDEPSRGGNPTLAQAFEIAGVDKYHFVGKSFLKFDD